MSASGTPKRSYSGLWSATQGNRVRYTLAMLMSTLASVFMLGAPMVAKYAIDVVTLGDMNAANDVLRGIVEWSTIDNAVVAYLILSGVVGVLITAVASGFQFGRDRLSAVASERISLRIRETMFDRLHRAPARFFDKEETGDLVQRCSSDIETVRTFMHNDVDEGGRAILFLLVMLPVLFWHNATLTWVSLSLMPLLVFGAYYFFKRITHRFQITDESEGALTAVIQENLSGIRVVQAFTRQDFEIQRMAEKNAAFRDNYFTLNKLMAIYWGSSDFVAMAQSGIVLVVGGYFVAVGEITFGELFLFVTLVSIVIWRVRHMGRIIFDAGKALVALGRINHVLAAEIEPPGHVPQIGRTEGELVLQDVWLNYEPSQATLQGVSLKVQAGETIGIVGAPGSGKSTLIHALLRMYHISQGRILLDGMDINEIDVGWLRRQFGVVLQDPFLFSRSIQDNLQMGHQEADEIEVHRATSQAAIHQSILGFSKGYQSVIGERGVTLSGGQRQRIALARALLRNPPILVLDDALSAIDTRTEQQILDALERRRGKHTTLVIAHRLTSVQHSDRILVMDDGRVAQWGTHSELSQQTGFYAELCEFQRLMDRSIQIEVAGGHYG